ncbi:MAG: ATP-binding protein [Clostridia bacterium]
MSYVIPADDFNFAGEASSNAKKVFRQLGIPPEIVRKAAISMYEAEMNAVIHGQGGRAEIEICSHKILIRVSDNGPGIPDVGLAMQEGYSTASDAVREKGFGAGMGLPNIKRHSDCLDIRTEVGKGTTLEIMISLKG